MGSRLEISQQQTLSQQAIQSLEILQMSSLDLTEYLKELTLENPVVEIETRQPEDKQGDRLKKIEWLAGLDQQNHAYYRYERKDASEMGMDAIGSRKGETLPDFLRMQLTGENYSVREQEIFEYIIQSLDERGYCTASADEIAEKFGVTEREAGKYLEIMRNLEPAGVCADSLKNCLLRQLEKRHCTCEVTAGIVKEYLELLGKNQLHTIAKRMKVPLEKVKEAQRQIRSLNPKPAQGFDTGEMFRYIVPDITVIKFLDHFEIVLNDYTYPGLEISREYLELYKTDCGRETKEYLTEKFAQARHVQECISRRNSTLLALAGCILEQQKDFFLYGEKNIRPLRRKDAAEIMNVHETTVSRALKDKYLQCCWGIYPLGYFFSRGLKAEEDAEEISAEKVRQELVRLIQKEDKRKPWSDQKLSELLGEKKIKVSRRTVAKYRESLGIAGCRGRKEF